MTRWIYLFRKVTGLASNNLPGNTFSLMKNLRTKMKKIKKWIKERIGLALLLFFRRGRISR